MTLAAHEDKANRGAYIASPSMPWVWADPTKIENPSGAYHLVWSRDLYEIATALLAAGDRAGAGRALTFLFDKQQKDDGCFPQNSLVDGTEHWTNIQLDEAAFPIVLAWQLRRTGADTYKHVKLAAACILANGPETPAGALGEPGRLVTRDDRGRDRRARHGRQDRARQRRHRQRRRVGGQGRRVAGEGRRLDLHDDGPVRLGELLPAHHQGPLSRRPRNECPGPERGHDLQDRRQRAGRRSTSARSSTRATSS